MQEKPVTNLLDKASLEDLKKIKAHQASTKGAYPVDSEWLLLAEFAKAYGWQAYQDAKNDTRDEDGNLIVTREEFLTLIEANRKLEARQMFQDAQTSFVGAVSAQTRKPTSTFKKLVRDIIKLTKADE